MTSEHRDLQPGDIGFSTIGGRVGALVNIGQALLHDSCRFTHAFLVLDNDQAIEAMPSGARLRPATPVAPGTVYFRLDLTADQRTAINSIGRSLVGTPYSFLDYFALAAYEWKWPGAKWARHRVTDSGHMICSQLVDYALCRVGFHLFEDGRLPQEVTPGDLFWRGLQLGHAIY